MTFGVNIPRSRIGRNAYSSCSDELTKTDVSNLSNTKDMPYLLCQERIYDQSGCCICGHIREIIVERWYERYHESSLETARLEKGKLFIAMLWHLNLYRPIWFGKMDSSSSKLCAQFISASTYSGAVSLVGRLYLTPSSHRYSYLMLYA